MSIATVPPDAVLRDWLARQGVAAEIRQTHASVVALAGDRVFKMKKPVRYPFLDLSTPELRLRVCERELELNRRLAPDVYLGLVAITDESGVTVDHAVEMVRLPDADRLDTLLAGDRAATCVAAVAQRMAQFHATVATTPEIAAVGQPHAVAELWQAELEGLRQFAGTTVPVGPVAAAERLAARYVAGRGPLLRARIAAEKIRDGHGDLRADDVFCMADGLRIIDCLEFDDRLRWGDVLADVAFLAMDLEWLGRSDLAGSFLAAYRTASGDEWPATLAHHWIGYRAHVRAKVACLRCAIDPGAAEHARGHLDLAVRHLRHAQVRLVLIGGLPGTGKTTLARALADRDPELTVLRSDVVRDEIVPRRAPPDGFAAGRYTPESVDRVYAELLRRAEPMLGLGVPVVLDASWSDERRRRQARDLARLTRSELVELRCTAPEQVTAARLGIRGREGRDESEADAAVARAMVQRFDPWPEAVVVDTDDDMRAIVLKAQAALAPAGVNASGTAGAPAGGTRPSRPRLRPPP